MLWKSRPAEPFKGVFPETAIDPYGFIQSKMQSDGEVYLFLDTLQEGQVAGRYCEKRQDWLRNELKSHLNDPVYVSFTIHLQGGYEGNGQLHQADGGF